MNILVVDRSPPCNLLQGNALIGQHLFRRLRHHQLTLVCPAPAGEIAHYQAELAQLFDAVHLVPRAKPVAALVGSFEPSLAQLGIRQAGSADPAAARALSRCVGQLLRQQSFDVIHTRQLPMAAITGGIDHPAKLLELIDSELFGHEKGAFTGAHATRAGYFEAADGGTLFLDEIGELPQQSQVRLLRVLQEHEVTRLGASKSRKIDVRIVAATNRVLPEEVRAGRFREDVFHRIAVGILALPPLRNREGDINLLIDALLAQINREATSQPGFKHKVLSVSARNRLLRHAWPGNVRELHNALLRASIWAPWEEIAAEEVAEVLALTSSHTDDTILGAALGEAFSLPDLMGEVARHYLERAMAQSHGNKTEAAKLLGLGSYQTLTNWLAKYHSKTCGTDGAS